jgi:hypothetical protein
MQDGSSSPKSRIEDDPTRSFQDDSSDEEEMDWEEVDVPTAPQSAVDSGNAAMLLDPPQAGPSKAIEITLDAVKKKPQLAK